MNIVKAYIYPRKMKLRKWIDGKAGYKYLGLLDADGVKDSVIKEGLGEEHI